MKLTVTYVDARQMRECRKSCEDCIPVVRLQQPGMDRRATLMLASTGMITRKVDGYCIDIMGVLLTMTASGMCNSLKAECQPAALGRNRQVELCAESKPVKSRVRDCWDTHLGLQMIYTARNDRNLEDLQVMHRPQ